MIKSVAVYLGSASPSPEYAEFAASFGRELARRGVRVVYGGADVGTMKDLADGVLSERGEIAGVFPKGFRGKREVAATHRDILRKDLTEVVEVADLNERRDVMCAMSDCCVVLPGGFGSMDELFCHAVGNEVGSHDKTAYVLNVNGYYDGLEMQVKTMREKGFLPGGREIVVFLHSAGEFYNLI